MTWKPLVWERTTVDEEEIERERMRALWKRLEAIPDDDDDDDDDEQDEES